MFAITPHPLGLVACFGGLLYKALNRFHTETHSPTLLSTKTASLSKSVRTEYIVPDKELKTTIQ